MRPPDKKETVMPEQTVNWLRVWAMGKVFLYDLATISFEEDTRGLVIARADPSGVGTSMIAGFTPPYAWTIGEERNLEQLGWIKTGHSGLLSL